jgi:hypothetical protein
VVNGEMSLRRLKLSTYEVVKPKKKLQVQQTEISAKNDSENCEFRTGAAWPGTHWFSYE